MRCVECNDFCSVNYVSLSVMHRLSKQKSTHLYTHVDVIIQRKSLLTQQSVHVWQRHTKNMFDCSKIQQFDILVILFASRSFAHQ